MTQIWKGDEVVPVTVVKAEPNKVSIVRTKERDGYGAVQVALGKQKREFRAEGENFKVGDAVDVSIFAEGDKIRVSGTTKGRGFQGAVKRWGATIGRMTHGSRFHRRPGSLGMRATPGRVFKNKHQPGQMGSEKCTVKNLVVMRVDSENNLLVLRGSVPGHRDAVVEIRPTSKK